MTNNIIMVRIISALSIILCFFFIGSCTSSNQKGFVINGETSGDYEGYIYLVVDEIILDSALVDNSKFVLTGAVEKPIMGYLRLEYVSALARIALENSKISVKVKTRVEESKGGITNMVHLEAIRGSQSHILRKKTQDIYANFYNSDLNRSERLDILQNEISAFVEQHPDHFTSGWLLGQADPIDVQRVKELSMLIDTTKQYKNDLENIEKVIKLGEKVKPGSTFGHLTLPDQSGRDVNIAELPKKVTYYDFWASWCAPCRIKHPDLNRIVEKYPKDKFRIVGISLDTNTEKWSSAITQDSLDWVHLSTLKGW